jgi:hypothetical protein
MTTCEIVSFDLIEFLLKIDAIKDCHFVFPDSVRRYAAQSI